MLALISLRVSDWGRGERQDIRRANVPPEQLEVIIGVEKRGREVGANQADLQEAHDFGSTDTAVAPGCRLAPAPPLVWLPF